MLFAPYFYASPSVRELQQDIRDLNQADLPEVDPEENSAEFMGILIKVHTREHNESCVFTVYAFEGKWLGFVLFVFFSSPARLSPS